MNILSSAFTATGAHTRNNSSTTSAPAYRPKTDCRDLMRRVDQMDPSLHAHSTLNASATSYISPNLRSKAAPITTTARPMGERLPVAPSTTPMGGMPPPPPPPLPVPRGGVKSFPSPMLPKQLYDYILVLDFEATCQENDFTFPHEIIEFPVVLVDTAKNTVVGEFHSYVKPRRFGGKLTEFCTQLTGITQATVDSAPSLETVIAKFNRWLSNSVPQGKRIVFATDGPTDMENFMYQHSVLRDGIKFPRIFFTYLDVRRSFCAYTGLRRNLGPKAMLKELGLEFEGRLHSGIDDTRNIARIVMELSRRGFVFSEAFPVCELRRGLTGPPNYNHLLPPRNPVPSVADAPDGTRMVAPCPPASMGAIATTTKTSSSSSNTPTPAAVTKEPHAAALPSTAAASQEDYTPAAPPCSIATEEANIVDEGDESAAYLLPEAAVDIVSKPASKHADPALATNGNRKRFATHIKKVVPAAAVAATSVASPSKNKLTVQHVSKLPSKEQSVPPSGSLDSLSDFTTSPGLTSNSSFFSVSTSGLPSSANSTPLHFGKDLTTPSVATNGTKAATVTGKSKTRRGTKRRNQSAKSNNQGVRWRQAA